MALLPLRFIGEPIAVEFDSPPVRAKTPPCPDRFVWRGTTYTIVARLAEWQDFRRRGRSARNMRPENLRKAALRGSWGVGRFSFCVRVDGGRVFELYYDRAPGDADSRAGSWTLYRELSAPPAPEAAGGGSVPGS